MSLWKIAWKSIEHRALASSLTAFSMSLGVALVVTVLVINGVISKTFQQGAQGYDLIVGAKGSRLQLVLSTVFYNQDPLAPIPYRYYELMKTSRYSAEIAAAIPIARGDNYQGFPVVGTNTDYFRWLQKPNGKPYTFNAGGVFKNAQTTGAVVGYTVAKKMGLKLGDKIRFGHTNRDDDLHDPFEVVGILDHTGSPNDRAVFVNLEGFYDQHSEQTGTFAVDYSLVEAEKAAKRASQGVTEKEAASPKDEKAAPAKPDTAAKTETAHDDHDHDHDHATEQKAEAGHDEHAGHDHGHSKEDRRLTAILLITKEKSVDVAATMEQVDAITSSQPGVEIAEKELVQTKKKKVYNSAVTALPAKIEGELLEAQAVAPVQEIASFYQDVLGNLQRILILFAVQVIIVAGIGMMVSIYNSMNERRQEIAIMRALGARRSTVMSIILFESILLSLGGGFLGLLIGHGLVAAVSHQIMEYTNVMVRPWDFQLAELILIPGLIGLASVVGYLPAVIAYRTDVAQSLQP
ncbi:MAG: ABC transporter permease [Planctomycetia bacterium]|nr:ABC transporter permease [Planctomycetia bacterium]